MAAPKLMMIFTRRIYATVIRDQSQVFKQLVSKVRNTAVVVVHANGNFHRLFSARPVYSSKNLYCKWCSLARIVSMFKHFKELIDQLLVYKVNTLTS